MFLFFLYTVANQESRLKEIFDAWKQEGAHVPIFVSLFFDTLLFLYELVCLTI